MEEQTKVTIDYDTIHPPSPKISKGGTIKKRKVSQIRENTSKTHHESFIDVHSTASSKDATDSRKSEPEQNSAYDSDVAGEMPTRHIKDNSNNNNESSSDVDIAPWG